jgi:signal peptidase II
MLVVFIILGVVCADQITKLAIITRFAHGENVPVIQGFFDLRYVRNTGAAWGIFAGHNTPLIVLSVIMLVVIFVYRRQFLYDTKLHRVAGGLMTGGIIGNLIDRAKMGYVIDFLDFYAGPKHFPAFNIADSAICVGVSLYILTQVLEVLRERKKPADEK